MKDSQIIPFGREYHGWADGLMKDQWGSALVVTRGRAHDTLSLPGFVAVVAGEPAGLVTYRIEGPECEIVSLNSMAAGVGVGRALVGAAARAARAAGCTRLWLITTNDNLAAVGFYQALGFHIAAIHLNALDESRRIKPEIPRTGIDGIPLTDEIELDLKL